MAFQALKASNVVIRERFSYALERSMIFPKAVLRTPLLLSLAYPVLAQNPAAEGRKTFESRCSVCHGADGNGGEMGPAIARRISNLTDAQLKTTILEGLPARG